MTDKTNVFTALIKCQPHFLERPLEDLLPMRFMGDVAVNAYRGLIKHLNDLPLSLEEKQSRLKDGQDAGKALLMIEARIGELLPTAEEARKTGAGVAGSRVGPDGTTRKGGGAPTLPPGISPKQAQRARAIANHKAEVAEVIKEAEENEDIPTKTAVLNKIAYKKQLEFNKRPRREKTLFEGNLAWATYYSKLEQAAALIPDHPPDAIVDERGFMAVERMWNLIAKKMEDFNGKKTGNHIGRSHQLHQGK